MSAQRSRELLLAVAQELVPEVDDAWPTIQARASQSPRALAGEARPAASAPDHAAPFPRASAIRTRRPPLIGGLRHLAQAAVSLILIGVVIASLAFVVPGLRQRGSWLGGKPTARTVIYGFGSEGFSARDLTTGTILGQQPPAGGQGAAWALAPDGRRAYVLDDEVGIGGMGWRLSELETPSLRVLRRTPISNAGRPLGIARTVAVAPDGREVYVVTLESRANPGQYPPSDREAITGIAVYDVTSGTISRRFQVGYCGLGPLFALADGTLFTNGALLIGCGVGLLAIEPQQGRRLMAFSSGSAGVAVSPDGRSFYAVDREGRVRRGEIDVKRTEISASLALPAASTGTPGAVSVPPALWIPNQVPTLSADGKRLFILGASTLEWAEYNASTLVLVVDATSLALIGVVPLPAPTSYLAPVGNGDRLLAGIAQPSGTSLRLIAAPDGREIRSWPGPTHALQAHEAVEGAR